MYSTNCQFGEFQLDKRAYQLSRNGERLKLERIPLDLLILLVDRPGQLVSREEIFQSIWGKNLFLDANNAINSAVRKLRRVLGDDPDAPKFLETVPGRGYRFIAKLKQAPSHNALIEVGLASRTSGPIMVGREAELARLQAWSAHALKGQRGIVFIAGETGIGKTTFVNAFLDTLGTGVRIGRGHCVEQYGAGEPYMPVLEAS